MEAIRPHSKPLALEPVDVSAAAGAAARPANVVPSNGEAGQSELRTATADEFLAAAAKEYQEGHIDPALWARAATQFGDDKSLVAAAYLRARATALQLQKRNKRPERRASGASSRQGARKRNVESEPSSEILPAGAAGVQLRGLRLKPGYLPAVAAALASVVAVVWLMASPHQGASGEQAGASAAAPSAEPSASASPGGNAQQVVGGAGDAASAGDSVPSLEAMVQQLKDAGSWNVLVLYASKWTRDEPNNAVAWSELGNGYANLRQFKDALGAATKAVELSPADARLWRNVGHLNVTLERLPEAGSAFDRALAVSADDADALCGAALVAHRLGRTKDAEAMAKRAGSADAGCPVMSDGESVAVVARGGVARKPASAVGR